MISRKVIRSRHVETVMGETPELAGAEIVITSKVWAGPTDTIGRVTELTLFPRDLDKIMENNEARRIICQAIERWHFRQLDQDVTRG